jgi:hypothetical protein
MDLSEDDLRRAAKKMISEHGPGAAIEAERLESRSKKSGGTTTASAWRKIRAIIEAIEQCKPDRPARA